MLNQNKECFDICFGGEGGSRTPTAYHLLLFRGSSLVISNRDSMGRPHLGLNLVLHLGDDAVGY